MSPFVFRMEKVRRVRKHMEDRAREELASSLAAQRASEAAMGAAEDRLETARDRYRSQATAAGATASELLAGQAYLERVEAERQMAARDRDRQGEAVQQRRDALLVAARDREALDRLRTRRLATHLRDAQRAAAATLDEIALRMHERKSAA